MIELSKSEKMLIKACKGHYEHVNKIQGDWYKKLKPIFEEIYGYKVKASSLSYKRTLLYFMERTLATIDEKYNGGLVVNDILKDIPNSYIKNIINTYRIHIMMNEVIKNNEYRYYLD
jgi:hypothetical protein